AEQRVAQHRDVVAPAARRGAGRASRARADDREAKRHARRDDVQEAPEREAGSEQEGCERGRHVRVVFRRTMSSRSSYASAERSARAFSARSTWSTPRLVPETGATYENGVADVSCSAILTPVAALHVEPG